MKISLVPLEAVIPYARNPRRNEAAVAKVAGSLKEFGFRQPIVVDPGMVVVAGHTRLMAARVLGMREVPVHVAEGLTPGQVKAYRLADNRTHEESEWDDDLLALELGDLREEAFDLALTGFDEAEIARALAAGTGEGLTDPDEVPPVEERVVSLPGDVWLLGRHRLVCGDATRPEDAARALGGVSPHLMVTDPPYGVSYDPAWRNKAGVSASDRTGKVANDDRADWREAWVLFPGDVAYVWHAGIHARAVAESLEASGFAIRSQIVWSKPRFALGRGDYHWQHEPCFYAVRQGAGGHWQGARDQSTLWAVARRGEADAATVHATQIPRRARPSTSRSAARARASLRPR